ncbi:MAG: phosphatidylserine synthase [Gammaproteobacteria bacterium]|nr:phosphatidylserine synthase [Gammaproteobacteria bacterium]
MHQLLLNRSIYEELILSHLPEARQFVWLVTADIKDMYIETAKGFAPLLQLLAELVANGVAIRLIHAKEPGPRFREDFDRFPQLVANDLFERILCPRVHTKAIIIDNRLAFVGSPNLTGAGMGSKHRDKRNFEAGFLFDDRQQIRELSDWVDALYLGEFCPSCRRREFCQDPLDSGFG